MPNFSDEELDKIISGKSSDDYKPNVSDEELDSILAGEDYNPREPLSEKIGKAGLKGMEYLGKGLSKLESYTAAPIRQGIYAAQTGKPVIESIGKAFGEDPSKAATGQMIAKEMGFSEDPYIKTPIVKNPWGRTPDERNLSLSPSQVAGAGITMATDPLMYAGEIGGSGLISRSGKALQRGLKGVGEAADVGAGKRAVKTALGHNIRAQRDIIGMTKEGIPNAEKVNQLYKNLGEKLLTKGEEEIGGKKIGKTVGFLNTTEQASEKAADKYRYWSDYYNKFKKYVDTINPQAISGEKISNELMAYAESLPITEANKTIKNRLYTEAENILENYPSMSMDEAIKLKGQFKYKRESPDLFTSSKDATNKMNGIIDDEIMNGIDRAINTKLPDGTYIYDYVPELKNEYKKMKEGYGLYKKVASTGSERNVRDVSNRALSWSDYMTGVPVAGGALASGMSPANAAVYGMAAAVLNKVGKEYGSSVMANTLKSLATAAKSGSKVIEASSDPLVKAYQLGGYPYLMLKIDDLRKNNRDFNQALEGQ